MRNAAMAPIRYSCLTALMAVGTAAIGMIALTHGASAGEPTAAAPSAKPESVLPSYAGSGFMATLKMPAPPAPAAPPPAGAEFRSTLAIGTEAPAASASAPTAPAPAVAAPAPAAPAATAAAPPAAPVPATASSDQAKEQKPGLITKVRDRIQQHIAKAKAERHLRTVEKAAPAAGTAAAPVATTTPAATQGNTPPAWPKLLPQQASGSRWSDADVTVARARCTQLLKQIDAVTIPEASIRDGECGAPAPVRVVSVGRKPEVAISPPALMTCDMAVALHDWVRKDVQPAARKLMGTEIIKIEAMSDYSCRNAYGRARTRLSEHGRANALDIRGFVTAKGDNAFVLEDWGRTTREIAWYQQQQRSIAQQHKPAPGVAPATVAGTTQPAGGITAAGAAAGVIARQTIVDGISRARAAVPGASADAAAQQPPTITFDMARLGGPKSNDVPKALEGKLVPLNGKAPPPLPTLASLPTDAIPAGKDARKAVFLRHAHASACRTFGTVLGPEANNAHRNHLHVDLAERATGAFCE